MNLMQTLTTAARRAQQLVRPEPPQPAPSQPSIQKLRAAWESGDLRSFEQSVHSQNGEDGIIREIFRRIGVKHRIFVEFGVETGMECNCARLVRQERWSGVFLESAP